MTQPIESITTPASDTEPRTPRALGLDIPSTVLSLTALAMVLVLLIAGWQGSQQARAEMVTQTAQLTVMTADGGNEDVLLILDGRAENLSVYRVQNQNTLDLFKRYELPKVFGDARTQAVGRK